MYVYMYVCMYVCMYVYKYVHVYSFALSSDICTKFSSISWKWETPWNFKNVDYLPLKFGSKNVMYCPSLSVQMSVPTRMPNYRHNQLPVS